MDTGVGVFAVVVPIMGVGLLLAAVFAGLDRSREEPRASARLHRPRRARSGARVL